LDRYGWSPARRSCAAQATPAEVGALEALAAATGDEILGDHLNACDGCSAYLEQIRQTVALLEQIDAIHR
jgi:hypothetical protein